jgi:phosphatidylglycerophosphate synthase
VLVDERLQVKPSRLGKWSTTLQLVTLGVALALLYDPTVFNALFLDSLVWATAVTTVVSGCQYLYRGLLWLQNRAASITPPG